MKEIGVKYCGGCNPQINRSKLVAEIRRRLPEDYRLTNHTDTVWETAILVCGCPAACANRKEVRKLAKRWILVSGSMVDLISIPECQIAGTIVDKIM